MKEIGSKIAVLIILVAMIFLASVLFDATNQTIDIGTPKDSGPKTYEDEMEEKRMLEESLSFEHYAIEGERYSGSLHEINFGTNPLAKNFSELILGNYELIGVNYAGHYSVVSWSCGIDCQNSIVVDVLTGDIVSYGIISAFGLSFSPTSNLLIINPLEQIGTSNELETAIATDYYEMKDGKLSLIAKRVNDENLIEECIDATTTARNFITNEIGVFSSPCQIPFAWEIIVN